MKKILKDAKLERLIKNPELALGESNDEDLRTKRTILKYSRTADQVELVEERDEPDTHATLIAMGYKPGEKRACINRRQY